jgi:hypothetical protein
LLEELTALLAGRSLDALKGTFVAQRIETEVFLCFQARTRAAPPGNSIGRKTPGLNRVVPRFEDNRSALATKPGKLCATRADMLAPS